MTRAGKGFSRFGVEVASASLFEAFSRDEEHFDGNAADGERNEGYGEKKNLHIRKVF
ncbi:MAG: hypothetical protein V2I46_04565 [Bacteroides sp.]|jgi:hypothetical protein|nr:hypothetical protein [Bacteroides sp.]